MSQPTAPPTLTPQFCFNERALRDFLRASRHSIDDSISTHLNALLTPSTTNPFTTLSSSPSPSPSPSPFPSPPLTQSANLIPQKTCTHFLTRTLLPTWSTRTAVLTYCTLVALSPDPDDPSLPLRELETQSARSRVVDERLDPYSGRFFPREARTERLAATLRLESGVERIVRRRVWGVLGERCAGFEGEDVRGWEGGKDGREGWEVALDKWREEGGNRNRAAGLGEEEERE